MTERPIIMSGESVRAILAGRKTQTRRTVGHPDAIHGYDVTLITDGGWAFLLNGDMGYGDTVRCPYGEAGDRLWVQEIWRERVDPADGSRIIVYRATDGEGGGPWNSLTNMPPRAIRLTLAVIGIRVERVQAITEADARAEGVRLADWAAPCRLAYARRWNRINGRRSGRRWDDDPWVWVVNFEVLR